MLVTFSSPASADVVMFGNNATQLIKFMNKGTSIPGTIVAEDIDSALGHLQKEIDQAPETAIQHNSSESSTPHDEQEEEPPVSIKNRALPLIRLLQSALKNETYITWGK